MGVDIVYDDEVMPYKKKAKHMRPKKSKHKHEYCPCVFEYNGTQLDKAHGFVPKPSTCFGSYCRICGKIGEADHKRWMRWVPIGNGVAGRSEYTDEAKDELNPATRTLPTFYIEDIWSQKFVPIIGKEIEEEIANIKAETERSYFRADAKEIQHMLK